MCIPNRQLLRAPSFCGRAAVAGAPEPQSPNVPTPTDKEKAGHHLIKSSEQPRREGRGSKSKRVRDSLGQIYGSQCVNWGAGKGTTKYHNLVRVVKDEPLGCLLLNRCCL